MISFAERFNALALTRSQLCLGLDPSGDLLRAWGLDDTVAGLSRFCDVALEAASDRVAVIKPQCGWFERMGPDGMAVLRRAIDQIRAQGSLSLADAKRGDFAPTMEGYASAFLGSGRGYGADAMTATAYQGFDTLRPVVNRAAACGAAVFVVLRSSNPGGRDLQSARHEDGRTVADVLADDISAANAAYGDAVGPVGAVVGATISPDDAAILGRLPASLILAPGVGAQGAEVRDVADRFGSARSRTLPSISRAILLEGPSPRRLRDAIDRFREEAWRLLDSRAGHAVHGS